MREREADEPRLFDLPLAPVDDDEREPEPAVPENLAGETAGPREAAGAREPGSGRRGSSGPGAATGGLPLFPDHDRNPEIAPAPARRASPSGTRRSPAPDAARIPAREETPAPDRPGPQDGPFSLDEPISSAAPFVSAGLPPGDPASDPPGYLELDEVAVPGPRPAPRRLMPAPFPARLIAAAADLGVHAAAAGAAWLGAVLLGIRLGTADLPALAVFLLAFSFLYAVVSLAFWGRTPGMAAAGVVSRGPGGHPLTFGQTGLRWLAAVVTAALLGLPLLVALTGRSLPDRLSGSLTYYYR